MQKFIAEEPFWQLFPDAAIAVLSLSDVRETAQLTDAQQDEIKQLLDQANRTARKYVPHEPISENPVPQVWRQAYQKFPSKKGARCSLEALLKRVLHDNPVGTIAPSVDITNAISLKYAFPIGAENLDAIQGDLRLGVMKGTEDFLPIGSDQQDPPLPGEVAYYDDQGVVCRCWNWRDGQRTEINDDTTNEFIAMECVQPERREELQQALDELAGLMEHYLGAKIQVKTIIDREHPEAVLR